ncbi:MAG TPA: hypothetical protein VNK95_13895 [Caldilineaceae bacterium]|nr:hypothetical protein [Caldilineaceae bacterium]
MSSLLSALTKPSVTNEPPSETDLRRNDIAVLVTLLFALFLGWGIRNNAVGASRDVSLGEGLPSIAVPARWITGSSEDYVIEAVNARSASIFDAELRVQVRPLAADENLVSARAGLGARRAQELLRYRELAADPVTVNGTPGMLVTYAYVADPTRDQGALAPPVVVQAQDLLFVVNDQLIVVTVAADAVDWDEEADDFFVIYDSLNVEEVAGDLQVEQQLEQSVEPEEGE